MTHTLEDIQQLGQFFLGELAVRIDEFNQTRNCLSHCLDVSRVEVWAKGEVAVANFGETVPAQYA